MLNVMAKIVTVFYFCEVEFSSLGNGEFFSELSMVLFILYSLSFLVVLFFAVLGIRGTLKSLAHSSRSFLCLLFKLPR